MNVTRKERKELNSLSKEVFGSSSRWSKLVDTGYQELLTEKVTETVPSDKEGEAPTSREVDMPVLKNGSRQFLVKKFTPESIKEFMLDQKKQLDEIKAKIKAGQEEQLAKKQAEEQAKEVHRALSGSAI